ncbi:MAG TPA: transcriptional regulator [Candidatus Dormibacteraeota bacterium]|nr:transcriptional regulator [Candidatus Dormibacteraeota bacterium]
MDAVPLPGNGHTSLRRALLIRLRQGGPASPDRLAADLGASRTGVLQQLRALEAAALVRHATERHGVGRPRHLYDVTAEAQDLFPSNYDGLASSLLEAVEAVGGSELRDRVFDARRSALADRARSRIEERAGPGADLPARVRELAVFQDELGYLAESLVAEDGVVRLVEHNCAIHRVAQGEPAACQAELDLFRGLLGVEVVRETHIASGDRCCTYRFGQPDALPRAAAASRTAPSPPGAVPDC